MKQEEIWKDITGYEGKYQVSSFGRVKSLEYHNAKGIKRCGILQPATDNSGYHRCALSKNNILKTYKVHRLVAIAFIPNPDNLPQINHKDGNKKNNNVENLEWCDNSHNQKHAYRLGLNPPHQGHKVKVALVNKITGERKDFDMVTDASNYLGYKSLEGFRHGLRKGYGKAKNFQLIYI